MATEARPDQGQAPTFSNFQELMEHGRKNGYKMDWLQPRETFGSRLDSDDAAGGLLLQDIDHGPFAQIPEWSDNMTGRPRGAVTRPNAPPWATTPSVPKATSG